MDVLRERGWRIEQMPCPELAFAGLNRFWAVREQYDTAAFRRHCQRLATAVAGAIAARVRAGRGDRPGRRGGKPVDGRDHHQFRSGARRPAGLAGRLPEHTGGEGIFVEELHAELERRGIAFRVAGETHAIPGHDEAAQRARLQAVLKGGDE